MQRTSPSADGQHDLPLPTPSMACYCANCDIQFASFEDYQVHKEIYCNTRHVHRSTNSSSSPNPGQQIQQQSQNQQPQSMVATTQTKSPENAVATTESESRGYNMVLNQPLYAAISTNPLILLPFSGGTGGGQPPGARLIPARNVIFPIPSNPPESASDSQGGNAIPMCTVMPGAAVADLNSVPSPFSGEDAINDEAKQTKSPKEKVIKQSSSKYPKRTNKEDTEEPLDFSFKKRG